MHMRILVHYTILCLRGCDKYVSSKFVVSSSQLGSTKAPNHEFYIILYKLEYAMSLNYKLPKKYFLVLHNVANLDFSKLV